MFIEGPTCVSESNILKPSRGISVSPPDHRPSGAAIFRQNLGGKVAFFELALFVQALFIRSRLGTRIRPSLACPARFHTPVGVSGCRELGSLGKPEGSVAPAAAPLNSDQRAEAEQCGK